MRIRSSSLGHIVKSCSLRSSAKRERFGAVPAEKKSSVSVVGSALGPLKRRTFAPMKLQVLETFLRSRDEAR